MVKAACENNLLCRDRDCDYFRRSGLDESLRADARPPAGHEYEESKMNKVAVIACVALGLAACAKNNADNNAANETAVENTAATDVNTATTTSVNTSADNALNMAPTEVNTTTTNTTNTTKNY